MNRTPPPPADDPLPDAGADEVADAALVRDLAASRELVDAPETLIAAVIGAFEARARPAAPAARPGWRQVLADLRWSGEGDGLALGLRGRGTGTRQWLYAAAGHDIDLRVTALQHQGRLIWEVSGQVLGPDEDGDAELIAAALDLPPRQVRWSELSEFRFDAVPEGRWWLRLSADDWEVVLPLLDLQAPAAPTAAR